MSNQCASKPSRPSDTDTETTSPGSLKRRFSATWSLEGILGQKKNFGLKKETGIRSPLQSTVGYPHWLIHVMSVPDEPSQSRHCGHLQTPHSLQHRCKSKTVSKIQSVKTNVHLLQSSKCGADITVLLYPSHRTKTIVKRSPQKKAFRWTETLRYLSLSDESTPRNC